MAFTKSHIQETITSLPACDRILVAYSGGMDSHVLLHSIWSIRNELTAELHAVHVNHGLQKEASAWAEKCRSFCHDHQIPISILEVDAKPAKGESPEAAARDSRYQAMKGVLQTGDILLTAHHSDDQAETVMLQLLRGSGPTGLSAMPFINGFGPGYHARPLLLHSRDDLREYAQLNELEWMEDFSNGDTSFDRNFLRQEVIPLLKTRWPSLDRTLSRSASHCAEAQDLIDAAAREDLSGMDLGHDNSLDVSELICLPGPRARAVIRTWISDSGFQLPDTAHLDRILREMLTARQDRNPVVSWSGVEIRRYRDRLRIMSELQELDSSMELEWEDDADLELPAGLGILRLEKGTTGISREAWDLGVVKIKFRSGGERCRPVGRDCSKSLKDLFQEAGIPSWERSRIPLIMINDQLAAVADLWTCENYKASDNDEAVRVCWIRQTDLAD